MNRVVCSKAFLSSSKESTAASNKVTTAHPPVKHPLALRALVFRTGSIAFREHGENLLLFFLSPEVALANMMKFPSSPPGVHCSGSCYNKFHSNPIPLIYIVIKFRGTE